MTIFLWILFALLLLTPSAALHKARRLDWRAILLLMCVVTLLVRI